MSTFRSTVTGTNLTYPVSAYSPQMYTGYAGWYDELGAWLNSTASGKGGGLENGFYVDVGGYGWYWNGVDNGSLDLVFAPGGGQRITFPKGDARTKTIFERVVKTADPMTKEALAESVVGRHPEAKETTGRAVPVETAIANGWSALVNAAVSPAPYVLTGSDKTVPPAAKPYVTPPPRGSGRKPGGSIGPQAPFYQQPWFVPAVLGVMGAAALTVVFWPKNTAPKTNPKRKKHKKRSR